FQSRKISAGHGARAVEAAEVEPVVSPRSSPLRRREEKSLSGVGESTIGRFIVPGGTRQRSWSRHVSQPKGCRFRPSVRRCGGCRRAWCSGRYRLSFVHSSKRAWIAAGVSTVG